MLVFETERLILTKLSTGDDAFILELVNTPGWLQFIGDRKVATRQDAEQYIQKIVDAPSISYWVVRLKQERTPIGVVTFLKKDYLSHHDLGFAFLPQYGRQGYAYESASVVLTHVLSSPEHKKVLAVSRRENINSVRILEKLGFKFEGEVLNGPDHLMVFGVRALS